MTTTDLPFPEPRSEPRGGQTIPAHAPTPSSGTALPVAPPAPRLAGVISESSLTVRQSVIRHHIAQALIRSEVETFDKNGEPMHPLQVADAMLPFLRDALY